MIGKVVEDQPTCRTKRISCAILIRKSTSIASNKLQYTNWISVNLILILILEKHSLTVVFGASYDFEYEDDEDEEVVDLGIENKYYHAKDLKAEHPEEAIAEFLEMPALEMDKGDWYVLDLAPRRLIGGPILTIGVAGASRDSNRRSSWNSS